MKTTCKGVLNSQEHQLISKFFDMFRTHRAVMDRELNVTGVPRSQHQILMFVSEHPQCITKRTGKIVWSINGNHCGVFEEAGKRRLYPANRG